MVGGSTIMVLGLTNREDQIVHVKVIINLGRSYHDMIKLMIL